MGIFAKKRFLDQLQARWQRLYRVAYSWTHDPHLSSDLVQETLARAIDKRKQLKDIEALDAWLFRILSNCWYDVCRQNKYLQELPDENTLVCEATPEADQYHRELVNKVQRAVMQLPIEQRQIVTLVDLEGFSYAEVAKIVDAPVGTVMSRLCRARNKLKSYLDELDVSMDSDSQSDKLRRVK